MNKNIKYSQNFLTSEKVLNQIIKQLNLKETDTVYEIGTGKGHLTTKLAKISKQVTSIELDSHLFNLSSEKLKLNTRVTLIHQDILQFQFPNEQRYKIVGNIPYHLSTQIIKKVVFESRASDIYLIVEEGFYKRTLDIHRTLGLLLHTQVSIQQLLKLPAECFHPKPKVNSVLIKLTKCPKCGNNIVLKKSFYGCSNYPECKFTLAEHFRKKKLTKTNVKELLEGKETLVKGIKNKEKKPYNAVVKIGEKGYIDFISFSK